MGFTDKIKDDDEERVMAYRDVTLNDLRGAVDEASQDLNTFEHEKTNPFVIRDETRWLKAVKVSCSADVKLLGKAKYRQVEIKNDHPIFFEYDDTSTISQHMGWTLLAKKGPLFNPAWVIKTRNSPCSDPLSNPEALQILFNTNPSDSNDGWGRLAFPKWNNGKDSTVLFARRDRNDITRYQIEALSSYCQEVVTSKFSDKHGEDERWAVVERFLNSEAFNGYFAGYCHARRNTGEEDWADAETPAPENKQIVSLSGVLRPFTVSSSGWPLGEWPLGEIWVEELNEGKEHSDIEKKLLPLSAFNN